MTLVIAQKIGKHISFSSDSRITFGTLGRIDFGIKVFSVPVKIESPTSEETQSSSIDYDYKLGLAVIGSAINAYTVKDSIYEILQNLQHIPGYTDLSMDGISNLVFKVYKKVTLDLTNVLGTGGSCQIILGGYCPIQRKVRVFKFTIDELKLPTIEPLYVEILVDNGIEFFGSGKTEAERVYNNNNELLPLHIIREVIRSNAVSTVGGGLQYGEFVSDNFKIFGIADYELYPDGTFKEHTYSLRGLSIYKDEFERDDDGFHIAYKFKMPFQKEIDDLIKRQIGD